MIRRTNVGKCKDVTVVNFGDGTTLLSSVYNDKGLQGIAIEDSNGKIYELGTPIDADVEDLGVLLTFSNKESRDILVKTLLELEFI